MTWVGDLASKGWVAERRCATGVVILDTVSSLFSASYTPPMGWGVAAGGEGQPGSPPLSPGPGEPIAVDEMSRLGRESPDPGPEISPHSAGPAGLNPHLVDGLGQGGPRWSQQIPAPREAQQPGSLEGGGWVCSGHVIGGMQTSGYLYYLRFMW